MKYERDLMKKQIAFLLLLVFPLIYGAAFAAEDHGTHHTEEANSSEDEVEIFLTLTRLKEDAAEADVLADGTLDRLVRDGLILDRMATSLMNDSESTKDISARLIDIAERMFIAEGTDLKEIGEELFAVGDDAV